MKVEKLDEKEEGPVSEIGAGVGLIPDPEMDEDKEDYSPTYSPGSPPATPDKVDGVVAPEIKDDQFILDGITYMYDADDGMIYHSETYDEVATYCTTTVKVTWKSKKYEMQHLKASSTK